MISRQRLRKTPSFACLLLAAVMLLQTLCFPIHTAHAAEGTEENINPGTTAIRIDNNVITFYVGSNISFRFLAAKVNKGDFDALASLGLNLRVNLTGNINLTSDVSDAEIAELTGELSAAYTLLVAANPSMGTVEGFLAADTALITDIRTRLEGGDTTWTPMGTEDYPFSGGFDGCGYAISGLNIAVTADENGDVSTPFAGLIGLLMDGCVQNLTVTGAITASLKENSTLYAGLIAGMTMNALLNNCTASGTITASATVETEPVADAAVGGLVGLGMSCGIINCGNETVIDVANIFVVGGIAGVLMAQADSNGNAIVPCIANSYSVGTIIGTAGAGGGLVGYAAANLVNNYFLGTMALTALDVGYEFVYEPFGNGSVGTIVGLLTNAADDTEVALDIRYNYFPAGYCPETDPQEPAGEIPGDIAPLYDLIVGKAIGCADVSSTFQQGILTSLANLQVFTPLITGTDTPASLCSNLNTQLWRSHQVLQDLIDLVQVLGAESIVIEILDGQAPKAMCWRLDTESDQNSPTYGLPVQYACPYMQTGEECLACGRGASYTITISTEEELFALADAVNSGTYQGKSFHLTEINLSVQLKNNITLTQPWTPMGTKDNPFSGNFDGCGHTISGMNVTILEETPNAGSSDEGGDSEADQGSGDPVAQSAGESDVSTIEARAVQYTGEPSSQADTTIDNSGLSALLIVLRNAISHAGFIGYLYEGGVQNLTVEGSVAVNATSTPYHVGMIAGAIEDSLLNNCRARGSVDIRVPSTANDSGNSGNNLLNTSIYPMNSSVGGLVGQGLHSVIINCGNEADVYAENLLFTGGIAGALTNVGDWMVFCLLNSYSVGTVTNGQYASGGLVGYAADSLVNNYFAGRVLLPAGLSDSSATGTLTGALVNVKDPYVDEENREYIDLDFWYNHYPLNYYPEATEDTTDSDTPTVVEDDSDSKSDEEIILEMIEGVIGNCVFDDTLSAKIMTNLLAGRVIVPYEITAPADPENDAYDIADPQALSAALNSQLALTNSIIAEHMSDLENSPWSHLIEKLNGDAVKPMCWDVPDGGRYPVQYTCDYETSGGVETCAHCGRGPMRSATINSVEITWGSMMFEYIVNGETGSWQPVGANSNLLTIRNTDNTGTKYVHIALSYTPIVTEVSASIDLHITEDGVDLSEVVPLSQPVEGDLPPPAPEYGWDGQITGYLLLESDKPTESLNNVTLGTITITISVPKTELTTWSHQHGPDENDNLRIHWAIRADGSVNSNIPGNTLTCALLEASGAGMADHIYAAADIADGLTIGASQLDPETGVELGWHSWTVSTDPESPDYDPNLKWTSTEWSYTIPQSIGNTTLGNDGWVYFINFTTSAISKGVEGTFGHMTEVTLDGQRVEGWVGVEHGEAHGNVVVFGNLEDDGMFHWDVKAIIPGLQEGAEADYFWYIMDYLEVFSGYDRVAYVENGLGQNYAGKDPIDETNLTMVTAAYIGADGQETVVTVPHISQATENDLFSWNDHWSGTTDSGIAYSQHVDLLCRCNCTADTCPFWTDGKCAGKGYYYEVGEDTYCAEEFCQCWAVNSAVTFTFSYRTPVSSVSQYAGLNLVNRADLWRSAEMTDGTWEGILVDVLDVSIQIPTTAPASVSNENGTPETPTEPGGAT